MVWQFVTWWCSLFGITDPWTIQIVGGVIVGGLGLAALGIVLLFGLAILTGVMSGLRRS